MNILQEHILLAGAWLLWCFLHSLVITEWWTKRVRSLLGPHYAWYRFGYVVFSIATLAPVLWLQLRIESPMLWAWPDWLKPLQWGGVLLSGVIFLLASRQYDQRFFFGFRQIEEHLAGREAEFSGFAAKGILHHMRHPYYSAGILLLLCWGDLTAATLVMKIVGIGYFIVGALLEEKKLVSQFGDAYRRYQETVPMFVPRLWRRG